MGYTAPTTRRANRIDAFVDAVLALSLSERWRLFDQLAGRPEVTAAGWRIAERRISPRPNEDRDAEWAKLHEHGLSYSEIAIAHHASRDTVAKAIRRFRQRVDTESLSTPEGGYYLDGGRKDV
jgi:DNA-directed RNA polymerase specialized sigma24 family protein